MNPDVFLSHDWFPRPLPRNCAIGDGSWLHSAYAFLHYRSVRPCGLRVGRHTGIYDGTMFDLGPSGEVRIGDFCTLVSPIFATNGLVTIGSYVFVSSEVVIADSFAAAPGGAPSVRPPSKVNVARTRVAIGDDVWIGARAVLLGGSAVGSGAIIGAGAVVAGDVPAYAIAAGNPARVVSWAYPSPLRSP